jgi:hypothetical protein
VDEIVARSILKWPNVPAVFGWLSLDRRGNWRIKGERISNTALREFISRNYEADPQGRWYFQNGPQRVYVALEYAPLVVRFDGPELMDHCGRPFAPRRALVDDEGSVLFEGWGTIALLDDRDLLQFADSPYALNPVAKARSEIPREYGFVPDPRP